MSSVNQAPRAPKPGSPSGGVNHAVAKPEAQEQYQTGKGCLLLAGIGIASIAVFILAALMLGNFD